jgi:hypothetical protein
MTDELPTADQLKDEEVALKRRLAQLRGLIMERDATRRDAAIDTLRALVVDQEVERELAYVAATVLARLLPEEDPRHPDADKLSPEALSGHNDEYQRMESPHGDEIRASSRLSSGATRRYMRIAWRHGLSVSDRVAAILQVADASEDEELHVTEFLAKIASSQNEQSEVLAAAGLAFARLRIQQGIYESVHIATFRPEALDAYAAEGKRISRTVE